MIIWAWFQALIQLCVWNWDIRFALLWILIGVTSAPLSKPDWACHGSSTLQLWLLYAHMVFHHKLTRFGSENYIIKRTFWEALQLVYTAYGTPGFVMKPKPGGNEAIYCPSNYQRHHIHVRIWSFHDNFEMQMWKSRVKKSNPGEQSFSW